MQMATVKGIHMIKRRFGLKLTRPSIVSIKHHILILMLDDENNATPIGVSFDKEKSTAIAALRRLKNPVR
jgi:hypothetical protein